MPEVYSGEWQLLSDRPDIGQRRWIMALENGDLIVKTETYVHSLTAEENALHLAASEGKKWGDGQVAARVPLDIWYRDLLPAKQNGDDKYVRKYLNKPENRWMRTFKGNM